MKKENQSSFVFWGNRIYDWMILNFLWILTSILGLGISVGAATSALFYAIRFGMKADRRDIVKLYLEGIKKHWKQATVIWLLQVSCVAAVILVSNFGALFFGGFDKWIIPFYGVLGLEVLMISMFAFPLLIQNTFPVRDLIHESFRLAHSHIASSLIMLAAFFASGFLMIRVSLVFLYLIPSVFAWWIDGMMIKIKSKQK